MTGSLLLDTCAVIWASQNAPLSEQSVSALNDAWERGLTNVVSPITAWEIGLLVSRNRLAISLDPKEWFATFVKNADVRLSELSPDLLIDSSSLPGTPPSDPADRIIIATARMFDMSVVTRDRKILDYAEHGHVKAICC